MFFTVICVVLKVSSRIMLTSKGFSVFFWIILSHKVSRHFPIHTRTSTYANFKNLLYIRGTLADIPLHFSVDLLSDTEFLVYKLPKTGRGMSETELALFADFIGGSYLWAGVPADIFVTPRTIQQVRGDKAKTREYHHRITVE